MVAAYKVDDAAEELIEALLEMSGILAVQERVAQNRMDMPRFPGVTFPKVASAHEFDELLATTLQRVNVAVETYRSIR